MHPRLIITLYVAVVNTQICMFAIALLTAGDHLAV